MIDRAYIYIDIDSLVNSTVYFVTAIMSQSLSLLLSSVKEIETEGHVFSPLLNAAPGSKQSFFLGGAGVRGLEIEGKFIKFTVIGVYLQDSAINTLAAKWKGNTVQELKDSVPFYRDIVTCPYEKFIRVAFISPLTGIQFTQKVTEDCVAFWKSIGTYTDAEDKVVETFINVFKDETFLPGSSVLFTQSPLGTLTISFSKDGSIPEVGNARIENKQLSEAVLETMIGKHGVSPAAKKSLAERLFEMFKVVVEDEKTVAEVDVVVAAAAPVEVKEITI